jgi:hypothetical protein
MKQYYNKQEVIDLCGKILDYRDNSNYEKPTGTDIFSLAEMVLEIKKELP